MNGSKVLGIAIMVVLTLGSLLVPAGAQQVPDHTSLKDYADLSESEYQWGPVYQVYTGNVNGPELLVSSDQDVAVVFASDGPDLRFAHLEKDGGILDEGTLQGASAHRIGWDAALGENALYVAWAEAGGRLMFQSYGLDGKVSGAPRVVMVDSAGISSPSIAISSAGTIYISYVVNRLEGPVAAVVALDPDGAMLISAKMVDPDGSDASMTDMAMGPDDTPYMLESTAQGTYIVAMDKAGSEMWHAKLYGAGQGCDPILSSGNGAIAATWVPASGSSVTVAVYNPQGANVAKDDTPIDHMIGDVGALLDGYGAIHVASSDGASIVHTVIGIGTGILFDQKVVNGVGPAASISLSSDKYGSLYLLYIDQGSGLYFVHADTYALEASVDNQAQFDGIHPGQEASGTLTIKNKGGMVDAIGIGASVMPASADWTVQLSSSEVYLQKDGEVAVSFSVRAPTFGNNGDRADLDLTIWAMSMPTSAVDIVVGLRLAVDYGVSISNPANFVNVPPGLSEDVKFTVQNNGEVAEDIYLSASSFTGTDGGDWGLALEQDHLVLEPSSTQDVNLTVTAPFNARMGQTTAVDLVAMVFEDQSRTARSTFYAVAQSDIELTMVLLDETGASTTGKVIAPGEAASYLIKVTNTGRSNGRVAVELQVVSGRGAWQAYLATESIQIGGGSSISVPMTVVAPTDAPEGTRFISRVTAKGLSTPVEGMLDVVTMVKKVSSLSIMLENRYAEADPGGELIYHLKVSNHGNGVETLTFRSETPFGWDAVGFYVDGHFTNVLPLSTGESATVEARARVPIGSVSGDQDLSLLVLDGQPRTLDVVGHVNMVSDIWFSSLETVQEVVDGQADFNFRVKNYGNGADEVRFAVEGLSSWKADFPEVLRQGGYLSLNPGKEKTVSMHVLVPEQVHNYSVEFNVRAIPLRGEGAVVRLMLKIVPTDLELSGPEFAIGSFVQGEIESITVRVRNNGPGPAGNVVVRAEDNGQLLGTETLTYVRAGDVRPATFTWAVTAGHHDLKFTVDPENRIFERNEENNELDYSVNAVTRTGPAPPVAPETIAGGTVIMTVAVAGVAAAWTETGRFKLMWLFWVPLYTKLKRTSILDHFVRGQVYGYIKANPGEHYNAIKKALALKNGTLVYHLQTLEREEYIKSVSDGRYKRFYPAGMKVPEEPLVRLNKIQEIILRLIGDRPAISQKEIADQIGLSGATINYHINVMLKANVIKMEKLGRTTHCYAIDEDGEVVEPTVVEEAEPQEPGSEEPKGP